MIITDRGKQRAAPLAQDSLAQKGGRVAAIVELHEDISRLQDSTGPVRLFVTAVLYLLGPPN